MNLLYIYNGKPHDGKYSKFLVFCESTYVCIDHQPTSFNEEDNLISLDEEYPEDTSGT